MYTKDPSNQIVIALLKKYGIKHMVLSAGTRNIPFVYSVENDPYFKCYSVVDERSAAYFAIGVAQMTKEPVVVSCTSSTATCNYYPAVAEAYHQNVPIIILTGDRHPYYLGQLEDQMIDQVGMYQRFCKCSVTLPFVKNEEDYWYSQRLVNEALLELEHHGKGPVHINVPFYSDWADFSAERLPEVVKINRYYVHALGEREKIFFSKDKRYLVICGQSSCFDSKLNNELERFINKYNCLVVEEHMSNINVDDAININLFSEANADKVLDIIKPDVVITFGGNYTTNIKYILRNSTKFIEHWNITESGMVCDTYRKLTKIFEGTAYEFFKWANNLPYYFENDMKLLRENFNPITESDIDFSNVSVIRSVAKNIPDNSILHLSILNSIRLMQYFKLPENVKVFANIGTDGIDGCLSSLIGQATVTDELAFLVIGDLSFFYDMNAMRINCIKNNIRIVMINNRGGAEFQLSTGVKRDSSIDLHTSARHYTTARGWVESVGFEYFSAENQSQFDDAMLYMCRTELKKPVFVEVFTDMKDDADNIKEFRSKSEIMDGKALVKKKLKSFVKNALKD